MKLARCLLRRAMAPALALLFAPLLATPACAPPAASPGLGQVAPAGRVGVHGMVVFGAGTHVFVSHIPMFRPPHDMQVIAEVTWSGGPRDYSDRLYTFEPRPFSLDALVLGEVVDLDGTMYDGNFEAGGRPIGDVHGHVERVVYARPLDAARRDPAAPRYMQVGDGEGAALVRVIDGAPGVDEIVTLRGHHTLSCLVGPDFTKSCAGAAGAAKSAN